MTLRELTHDDLPAIAEVHCAGLPQTAVARLGRGIALRYYRTLVETPPGAEGIGAFEDGVLAGFCYVGVRRELEPDFLRTHLGSVVRAAAVRPWLLADPWFRERIGLAWRHLMRRRGRPIAVSPTVVTAGVVANDGEERSFGIQYLVVHPQRQRGGVGRALLRAGEDLAKARGRRRVELSVFTDNRRAIAFYEANGWTKVRRASTWDGVMQKALE